MDLNNHEFFAGAVAAAHGDIDVTCVATGYTQSTCFSWYRVYDQITDQCVVVLKCSDSDEGEVAQECLSNDKKDCTRALFKTLDFGEDDEEVDSYWFSVLNDGSLNHGSVNYEHIDETLLRATLEKGAAQLDCKFDFNDWALKAGFYPEPAETKKRKRKD